MFSRLLVLVSFMHLGLPSQLLSTFYNSSYWNKLHSVDLNKHVIHELIAPHARFEFIGTFSSSPFVFDRECISVVRTNTLLEVDCQLPSRCGTLHHELMSKSILGQEVRVCYSFHHTSFFDFTPFYRIKFSKIPDYNYLVSDPNGESTEVVDIVPVDFFDHLVVSNVTDGFNVYPQICLDHFTSSVQLRPLSVKFRELDDTLCVDHEHLSNADCEPLFFSSASDIILYFNFPIAFKYNPYVLAIHSRYFNQDPDVASYAHETSKPYYPISSINGVYFVSRSPLYLHFIKNSNSKNFIYHESESRSSDVKNYCYKISSLYKNPLSELASSLISIISPIFYKILELFELEIENILKLVCKSVIILAKLIINMMSLIITPDILSAVLCTLAVYIYFRDLIISFISFLLFMFLFCKII